MTFTTRTRRAFGSTTAAFAAVLLVAAPVLSARPASAAPILTTNAAVATTNPAFATTKAAAAVPAPVPARRVTPPVVPLPVRSPVKFPPFPFPTAPGNFGLQASAKAVTVQWIDGTMGTGTVGTNTVQDFVVYKRNSNGVWIAVHTVPATDVPGEDSYMWVDTDQSVSAQCYKVAAVRIVSSFTVEECTVRPDPAAFPQSSPPAAVQWYGLSSVDDGIAPLYDEPKDQYLKEQGRTFGVGLGWGADGNNVKLQRQGSGPQPLMKGEALALRVWGGGWLKYGHETFGLDLQLSETPVYEWHIVGDGLPGQTLDSGEFALWNSSADDYLVQGGQTWGIDLNWYKQTLPKPVTPPPPPPGVRAFVVSNCTTDDVPLEMWVLDATARTGWIDEGALEPEWEDDGCPDGGQPFLMTPVSGHSYVVEAVDTTAAGCSNSPDMGCDRSTTTFTGDANGVVTSTTVS